MIHKNAVLLASFSMIATMLINYTGIGFAQPADNTRINQRDSDPGEVTADEQGRTKNEVKITQLIRRALINNTSLSMYAHNVKIITAHGMVTLKGPVASEEERNVIMVMVSKIIDVDRIHNEMSLVSK